MKYEKWPPARMWFLNVPDDKLWINLLILASRKVSLDLALDQP